ncbi:MAG TPA: F0F1 ATP synthase subunit epsilon [Vicinamibacteria bacterium]|nr:F0F1 ATP synthase subunit epsilon [Vicinamibacteria bacterium]
MDDKRIELEIVTPAGVVLRESVDEVEAPGVEGHFGVLPGHRPFLTQLRAGELRYRIGRQNQFVAVHWGFAEILPHRVTVLVETAELAGDIDLERAETAKKRALERLQQFGTAYDLERARKAYDRATARLAAAQLGRSQGGKSTP